MTLCLMFFSVPPLPLHPLPSPTRLSQLPLARERAVGQRPQPWGRIKARLGPVRAGTSWKSRRGGKESSPRSGSVFIGRKTWFQISYARLATDTSCTPGGGWEMERQSALLSQFFLSACKKKRKKKCMLGFILPPSLIPSVHFFLCL